MKNGTQKKKYKIARKNIYFFLDYKILHGTPFQIYEKKNKKKIYNNVYKNETQNQNQ